MEADAKDDETLVRTKVVIVGAGISGLAAAKTLEDNNTSDYVILEAQSQIGGRAQSLLWNDEWIELGAQFLHGDGSELAELSKRHDLLAQESSGEGEGLYLRDDGLEIEEGLVRQVDCLVRDILEECENWSDGTLQDSIGLVLQKRFKDFLNESDDSSARKTILEELLDWNVRFLVIDNSCDDLDKLSTKSWGNFKYVGGPEHLLFESGYSSLINSIVSGMNRRNLRLNCEVTKIERTGDQVIITTANDPKKIVAECAIVTCSLGFLKEHHERLFAPALPGPHRLAIECLGFGVINKVFLDFGEAWWDDKCKGFQLVWKRNSQRQLFAAGKLASWTRCLTGFDVLHVKRERRKRGSMLLGWVGGKGAVQMEELSEFQVGRDCQKLLSHFLRKDVPSVKKCIRTQWSRNRFVRGGYSNITVEADAQGVSTATLAQPIWSSESERLPVILLAGEATHDKCYSTTHGAYESGVNQAQAYLRYRVNNNKTCQTSS